MQFPCLYHIPRFSTAFSANLIPFSAKTNNILLLFTFPFYTITETPDFCVKVYFCLIVRFFPQSPSYQRHLKTRKNGVHQPFQWTPPSLKTLDFKPFFNTFACEYPKSYGIIFLLPPGRLLMIVSTIYLQKWTPPLPTATDFQTTPKSNKRFPQHPMCRNPLFSAVSPIFCSCPLYQLSGLHFHILINYMESVFLCKLC